MEWQQVFSEFDFFSFISCLQFGMISVAFQYCVRQ
jgi:hypothetical protein